MDCWLQLLLTVALVGFISYKKNKIQSQNKLATQQPNVTPVPVFEPVVNSNTKQIFQDIGMICKALQKQNYFLQKQKNY